MGAKKDMAVTFSTLSQKEVESFCSEWDIDVSFNPVAPTKKLAVSDCPSGSMALYCRHFEFANLRHPFSVFLLNVLEYYRVSLGQIHPHGVGRVLHFECLCRALGYDPTLLMFRRFFRLAKNGDWFTFEGSSVETNLLSSHVTTVGQWKTKFFWVSESILPFKPVWRSPEAVLNEAEPSESELDHSFLTALRACPSRLRPFAEPFLVLSGVSTRWDKPGRDPVIMKGDRGMSFCSLLVSLFSFCLVLILCLFCSHVCSGFY
jgi:hypothetical protein